MRCFDRRAAGALLSKVKIRYGMGMGMGQSNDSA